ncbi:MAG: DUF3558 domain-containing protein [Pseudonocardiaceae bacterium]
MRRVPVALVLATLLAGCSAGGARPTAADAAPAAPADPIPLVHDPKGLAGTMPCALLTPAQLVANRIDRPGQPEDVLGAPGCEWDDKAHTREIRIFADIGTDVLHNIYAQRATFPVFEVTQVAGYPAIRTKNNAASTSCFFRVAAAQTQTLNLMFTSLREGLEEPCGPAKALAEAVIANLPPLKG